MNNLTLPPPDRQQFDSYAEWLKVAKRYISQNAPSSRRIFLRNATSADTKPWHRWVLPILLATIASLMIYGGVSIFRDYNDLVAHGQHGMLEVSGRHSQIRRTGAIAWRLDVAIDGQSVPLKGSYSNADVEGLDVGSSVDALYRSSPTPLAFWPDGGANAGTITLMAIGGIVLIGAAWLGFGYKGSIDPEYRTFALGELEVGRPLPQ